MVTHFILIPHKQGTAISHHRSGIYACRIEATRTGTASGWRDLTGSGREAAAATDRTCRRRAGATAVAATGYGVTAEGCYIPFYPTLDSNGSNWVLDQPDSTLSNDSIQ
ncbi:hypothetical protein JCGZ_14777 [Jatropha curcas]|uniref:Uncharacterized protein n=1 Tax=Jatropha curcas TaxID=180498 RepID=A0A067K967_JATCU|nr:hypothetical protein JCGZ_14777 [Jatropha curcas]